MRLIALFAAAAIISGCNSLAPGSGFARTDGTYIAPGSPEEAKFIADRQVCRGELAKAQMSAPTISSGSITEDVANDIQRDRQSDQVMLGCMADKGYRFVSGNQS
jgi:hypothetical protein